MSALNVLPSIESAESARRLRKQKGRAKAVAYVTQRLEDVATLHPSLGAYWGEVLATLNGVDLDENPGAATVVVGNVQANDDAPAASGPDSDTRDRDKGEEQEQEPKVPKAKKVRASRANVAPKGAKGLPPSKSPASKKARRVIRNYLRAAIYHHAATAAGHDDEAAAHLAYCTHLEPTLITILG